VEVNGDAIERYTVSAGDVGLDEAPEDAVAGGTPDDNARVTRAILAGEPGPHADLAFLNAGAAIYAAGRADTLAGGVEAAREACADGSATNTLESFVGLSQELAPA
jgi:anthranilate phosphoribosyltransferase